MECKATLLICSFTASAVIRIYPEWNVKATWSVTRNPLPVYIRIYPEWNVKNKKRLTLVNLEKLLEYIQNGM